jgi:hypothetical protein
VEPVQQMLSFRVQIELDIPHVFAAVCHFSYISRLCTPGVWLCLYL